MAVLFKKCLGFLTFVILLVCSFGEIKADGYNAAKIPFKLTQPKIYTIILKDKHDNPVKAKVTFQEYTPPFEVNQTFGLEWNDLDFSTVEQVYIGFAIVETLEQYLNMHYGEAKESMKKHNPNAAKFKQDVATDRRKNPLAQNYSTYYSKCIIEALGDKYTVTKRLFKYNNKEYKGFKSFYYDNDKKWKNSSRFENLFINSAVNFFSAYKHKDTPAFIKWLEERRVDVVPEKKVSAKQILMIVALIIVMFILWLVFKKIKH